MVPVRISHLISAVRSGSEGLGSRVTSAALRWPEMARTAGLRWSAPDFSTPATLRCAPGLGKTTGRRRSKRRSRWARCHGLALPVTAQNRGRSGREHRNSSGGLYSTNPCGTKSNKNLRRCARSRQGGEGEKTRLGPPSVAGNIEARRRDMRSPVSYSGGLEASFCKFGEAKCRDRGGLLGGRNGRD